MLLCKLIADKLTLVFDKQSCLIEHNRLDVSHFCLIALVNLLEFLGQPLLDIVNVDLVQLFQYIGALRHRVLIIDPA